MSDKTGPPWGRLGVEQYFIVSQFRFLFRALVVTLTRHRKTGTTLPLRVQTSSGNDLWLNSLISALSPLNRYRTVKGIPQSLPYGSLPWKKLIRFFDLIVVRNSDGTPIIYNRMKYVLFFYAHNTATKRTRGKGTTR
jgi:hypothetical protein